MTLGSLIGAAWMRRWWPAAAILMLIALAMALGTLKPLEDALASQRFRLVERAPSQEIVVVEIDAASLRAAGQWPWTRERYARAVAHLNAAGAEQIGFDVDFSARSYPAADAQFAQAISDARAVILPTFVQHWSRHDPDSPLIENRPMADLSDKALLASVNVPVESDGRVWRYLRGFGADDTYRPTMAHLMAGGAHGAVEPFLIDYGIRPGQVPRLSFQEVYEGRFDPALVKGRTVLIGATALELGDTFATPRHGILAGVLVHALAFESLRQGRALYPMPILITLGLCIFVVVRLRPGRPGGTGRTAARHLAGLVLILGLPVAIQTLTPIQPSVAPLLLTQILCLAWTVQVELQRRARAIQKAREASLFHLAMHEPESELPNRRALLSEIGKLRQAPGGARAVAAIGIDRFPEMRAAVGYGLVNHVVRAVAARLLRACHGSRVAYLSTGVIGLVVSRGDEEALQRELSALAALAPAYEVEGHLVDAYLRLGVAYDTGLESDDDLLEHAAAALDEARRSDRRLLAYDPASFPDPRLTLALMSEMERGLEAGELSLFYQPKAQATTGAICGVEALMRWRHPVRGPISPEVFITAAEETGAIRSLTEWTIRQALADSAAFRQAGHRLLVSINVSGRLLGDAAFRERALDLVRGREGEICFEITETAVIESPQAATASVAAFRAAGIKISIDDYGVGLSSLSYLKLLRADELKLDRSIAAEAENPRDQLIVKSTIELAHGLGMEVVAEGVEDERARRLLASLGCDLIQGYLIAPPLPADGLLALLERPAAA